MLETMTSPTLESLQKSSARTQPFAPSLFDSRLQQRQKDEQAINSPGGNHTTSQPATHTC